MRSSPLALLSSLLVLTACGTGTTAAYPATPPTSASTSSAAPLTSTASLLSDLTPPSSGFTEDSGNGQQSVVDSLNKHYTDPLLFDFGGTKVFGNGDVDEAITVGHYTRPEDPASQAASGSSALVKAGTVMDVTSVSATEFTAEASAQGQKAGVCFLFRSDVVVSGYVFGGTAAQARAFTELEVARLPPAQ